MTKSDKLFQYVIDNMVSVLRLGKSLGFKPDVKGAMTAAKLVRDGGTFDGTGRLEDKLTLTTQPTPTTKKPQDFA